MANQIRKVPPALNKLVATLNKKFGDGTIMRSVIKIDAIPTGIPTLDLGLGCGGLPRGRIIEIFGAESHGKTTTALQALASCQNTYFPTQKRYGIVAVIDVEHSFDRAWATKIGVNMDELLFSQPDSAEEALDIVDEMAKSGTVDLIVVDSVSALVPQEELDGSMGDTQIGAQSRLMSKAMRKLKGHLNQNGATALFTNQIREKIGVMFGDKETTTGGRALRFYASQRINVKKIAVLKDKKDEKPYGIRVRAKVVKNKVAPPFVESEYSILFGDQVSGGIDRVASLLEAAIQCGLVNCSGGKYSLKDGAKIGIGESKVLERLRQEPEINAALTQDLYNRFKSNAEPTAMTDEELATHLANQEEGNDESTTLSDE